MGIGSRLSLNSRYNPPAAALIAVLAQVNALPDAQVKLAFGNGNGATGTQQRIFYMGRHVVFAFIAMLIIRRAFRHKSIKVTFHILAHRRIGILINRQRCRCMLDKEV